MTDTAAYDEAYYASSEYGYFSEHRADHDRILALLAVTAKERVLEIGCGTGALLARVPSRNTFGVETNEFAVGECRRRGLEVIKRDAEQWVTASSLLLTNDAGVGQACPFPTASFDVIIMNEVVEHLRNPESVLRQCGRLLAPAGRIVITTPVRSVFAHDLHPTHFSEMGTGALRALVERSGFTIVTHEVAGISFLYPVLEHFCFRPFRWFRNRGRGEGACAARTTGSPRPTHWVDAVHAFADVLLKPLTYYRKNFLYLGLTQLILAKKA